MGCKLSQSNICVLVAAAWEVRRERRKALTDPSGTGWFGANTQDENGHKCAYIYGPLYKAPACSEPCANVHLGARDYRIQQNWLRLGTSAQFCATLFPQQRHRLAEHVDRRSDGPAR
jgi:hypothetical protein